ncbi:MAG TPA: hypothetical protein PKY05_13820 [Fibrobacteria bacterium]|nr:hypothetical protein [Fibrobacteria bacterium]
MSAAFLACALCACDSPGTAPPTNSDGMELILQNPTSGVSKGGSDTDTTGPDDPVSPTVLLDTSDLLGPVVLPVGGSARRLTVFLETDRTLHVWATSDGTKSGTYDRFTNWSVQMEASTALDLGWVRNGEAPYRATLYPSDSGRTWFADIPSLATAHEFRIRGPKGTVVTFRIDAASGFRPANWEEGSWSPTPLSDAETTALLTMGLKQKPIGSNVFKIRLP